MMGHFLKAHSETAILPTQSKGVLYNLQLWEKCGFFTILYIYPETWRNFQPKATGRNEKKKTSTLAFEYFP